MIAVSIVSHGHGAMVGRLATALLACPEVVQLLVTRNIPEALAVPADARLQVIDNAVPQGFGANHNAAFVHCTQPFFCPLNPDIELDGNPFPALLAALARDGAALAAPLVRAPDGSVEDSIRHFPTLGGLLRKALGRGDGRYRLPADGTDFHPEWVAGMFMLFRSEAYGRLGGFDEGYFLYYEDVDICIRLWRQGLKVLACPAVSVVHDARRDSRRNPRHLRWHLASMARYFRRHWGRLPEAA